MAQSQMPQMPAEMQQPQQVQQDMSVILVTAGCKSRSEAFMPVNTEKRLSLPPVFRRLQTTTPSAFGKLGAEYVEER